MFAEWAARLPLAGIVYTDAPAPVAINALAYLEELVILWLLPRWTPDGEQKYASIAVYEAERSAWVLQMRSSQW